MRGQAFSWCQNVPKRPSRRPNTRSVEMACLQEWDADRRQAAHAEKSLAVRELVRLSLRVQSTGVVAELHLDTALVATSGSGADHERRIRRGCQATDGRADSWRGVLNNARACSTAARRSLRPRLSLCALPFAAAFPKATLALDASWHRESPPTDVRGSMHVLCAWSVFPLCAAIP